MSHVPAASANHDTPNILAHVTFKSLALATPVLDALNDEGYHTPTPIQAQAIPPVMAGRDLLGCAQTGTGKTAAFALPIIHRLLTAKRDTAHRGRVRARALILSPTRELASQIAESFAAYGRHSGLTGVVIFGGVGQRQQVRSLERGVDVIVATPGRLLDLMNQGHVDLSGIEVFVLDEADRMLDMGFIKPIRTIAAELPEENRQTLLFSATMPKEIKHLADSLLDNPVRIAVTPVASTAPLIEQKLFMVPRSAKQALLEHFIVAEKITRALVFTKTKHGADKLCKKLHLSGIHATAIHGNKAQNQRERALEAFRSGRVPVLVATDVAARGLDVDDITHVFNYDLPMEPEAYVHRIGRTGRAGRTGIAISFCDSEERGLLRDIEKVTGKKITPSRTPDAVMVHMSTRLPDPAAHQDAERQDTYTHQQPGHHPHPRPHAQPRTVGGGGGGGPRQDRRFSKPAAPKSAKPGGHRGANGGHHGKPKGDGHGGNSHTSAPARGPHRWAQAGKGKGRGFGKRP